MMVSFLYCLIRISEHGGGSGTSGQLGERGIRRMPVKVLLQWQFRILTQNYEMYFMNLTLLSISSDVYMEFVAGPVF